MFAVEVVPAIFLITPVALHLMIELLTTTVAIPEFVVKGANVASVSDVPLPQVVKPSNISRLSNAATVNDPLVTVNVPLL